MYWTARPDAIVARGESWALFSSRCVGRKWSQPGARMQRDDARVLGSWLGHTHVLLTLSQLGADMEKPDENGITPVSIAGHQGHVEAVRLLVNLGADLEATSDNGATPFWSACRAGHLEVAKLLASRGVDVRAPARNRTPRDIASAGGHDSIVTMIDSHIAAAAALLLSQPLAVQVNAVAPGAGGAAGDIARGFTGGLGSSAAITSCSYSCNCVA